MMPSNPTPPDPDSLVDRRRLKRQLSAWRVVAIVAALAAIAAAGARFGLLEGYDHVAVLRVSGIITNDDDRAKALAELVDDDSAKALLLRIDSPGGTVVGGESLFRQIRAVAAKKPVVAVLGEVAASGGYMVALAADHIVAREGTITGSIGVIMQTTDVTGLLNTLGIATEAIKSAPLKAVPSPLEPLTETGREATRAVVLDMFEMFVDMVAERRGLPRDTALRLADGRVYTGRQAKGLGLIDAIGGEETARAWLATKGVDRDLPVRPLRIRREDEFWREMLTSLARAIAGKMFSSERLTLDGLVSVWHPDVNLR
jgi:protease-4